MSLVLVGGFWFSATREAPDWVLVLPSVGEASSELDAHILTTGSQFGHTMHDTVNRAFSPWTSPGKRVRSLRAPTAPWPCCLGIRWMCGVHGDVAKGLHSRDALSAGRAHGREAHHLPWALQPPHLYSGYLCHSDLVGCLWGGTETSLGHELSTVPGTWQEAVLPCP